MIDSIIESIIKKMIIKLLFKLFSLVYHFLNIKCIINYNIK